MRRRWLPHSRGKSFSTFHLEKIAPGGGEDVEDGPRENVWKSSAKN